MKGKLLNLAAAITAGALLVSGCATDDFGNRRPWTETHKGVGIGAAAGAAIGAAAAKKSGKGAAIGALGGAMVGGLIGNYMEKQRRDFEKVLAPEIAAGAIRVEKLSDSELLVGMTGETAFEVDSDRIKPGFFSTMDKIAQIVNKYGKTDLDISGHTDSTGSAQYNEALSERRAQAVQTYLLGENVHPSRMSAVGYGMNSPIASNESKEGRRLNRRVDLTIIAVPDSA